MELFVLLSDVSKGLDFTDEGLYLLSAWNHQPTAAFNGWSGQYLGFLFGLVGHDIPVFRILGIALLALAGGLVGTEMATFLERLEVQRSSLAFRALLVVATAGAALVYELLYLRTPSYNWLALVALLIASAGLFRYLSMDGTVDGPSATGASWSGLLLGLGAFLGFVAKVPTGLAIVATVVAVAALLEGRPRSTRRVALLVGSATLVGFFVLHLSLVSGFDDSLRALQRSVDLLGVIDPSYYRPASAAILAVLDALTIPWRVFVRSDGLVLVGLLPLLPPVRRSLERWPALPVVGPVVAVGLALLVVPGLRGGTGWRPEAEYALACLTVAFFATASSFCVRIMERARGPREALVSVPGNLRHIRSAAAHWWTQVRSAGDRRLALAVLALVAAAGGFAAGSNNGFVSQLGGAASLVLVSTALLAGASLRGRDRRWAVAAVLLVAEVASLVALVRGHSEPYRLPPFALATQAAAAERLAGLRFDAATGAYWDELMTQTDTAGWRPATPLLDLTWSPAVSYVLDATVPDTLTVVVGKEDNATASAIEGLRLSPDFDPMHAWIVTSPDRVLTDVRAILASVDRRFPDDYRLVAELAVPVSGLRQQIWQPVSP